MSKLLQPNSKLISRRGVLAGGVMAGVAGALAMPAIATLATSHAENMNDIGILNNALFYEHQAIWAYSFAAGKLSSTDVGKAVLALALRNQNDHKGHRDLLASAVASLGGTPVAAVASYDVSSYITAKEGNIDSDVNIAKLALALEVDAAIAYTNEVAKLKTPALVTAGATIGSTEAAHAAAIRATFKALGVGIEIVPDPFISQASRRAWILPV